MKSSAPCNHAPWKMWSKFGLFYVWKSRCFWMEERKLFALTSNYQYFLDNVDLWWQFVSTWSFLFNAGRRLWCHPTLTNSAWEWQVWVNLTFLCHLSTNVFNSSLWSIQAFVYLRFSIQKLFLIYFNFNSSFLFSLQTFQWWLLVVSISLFSFCSRCSQVTVSRCSIQKHFFKKMFN